MFYQFGGQSVEAQLAISLLAFFPARLNPLLFLKPPQRRIERTGFHLEHVFGSALDVLGNSVPVRGSEDERTEDEHVEGALDEAGLISHVLIVDNLL